MKIYQFWAVCGLSLLTSLNVQAEVPRLTPSEQLGKALFFETRLSNPAGQSCASCHSPESAFSDPRQSLPVSPGAAKGMFTSRNAPSVMYLARVPALHIDKKEGIYMGGLFYDGRANTLEAQIEGPAFSPNEMAIRDKAELVNKLRKLGYEKQFRKIYGSQALATTASGYQQMSEVIAAYERSTELNPYTAKYDYYLKGKARLTAQERRGLKLFEDEKKGNCAACHPTDPQDDGTRPMFTDFSYDNLGVPKNPNNPFLQLGGRINAEGKAFTDMGLGKIVSKTTESGKFRVPGLRNVELTAPYMHNGVFKTLKEVVDFYNTRDVDKQWAKPEVAANVNRDELGNLKLTEQEVDDIVVFMKTLTDGYRAE